jgi:uncharacterized protein with PQ loop repeat
VNLVGAIGWVAALAGIALGVPQALRLWRTRDVGGISMLAWQAMLVLNVGFGVHGLTIAQPNMVVTNALALVSTVPILVLLASGRERPALLVLVLPLVVAALVVAGDLWLGSAAFGVLVVVPTVLVNLGQGAELVRSPVVSGVSGLYLAFGVLNQALWLTWAWLVPDPGTMIGAGVSLAMIVFNLSWWGLRRLGLRAFFVSTEQLS